MSVSTVFGLVPEFEEFAAVVSALRFYRCAAIQT